MSKICFLINDMSSGGAQRVVSILANKLLEAGNKIVILTLYENDKIAYELNKEITVFCPSKWGVRLRNSSLENKVDYLKYRLKRRMHPNKETKYEVLYNYEIISDKLINYFRNEKFDIIYSFLLESNIAIGLRRNKIKCKIIMAERNFPDKPMDSYLKYLRDKCYKRCDKLVCQTTSQALCFDKKIQKKSVVINNPVKDGLPDRFVGERRKVIVNYCGFKTHKNIPLLIKACAEVFTTYPEYSLELYGYGETQNIETLCSDLNISDKVKIFSFLSDIHEQVKDACCFCMTSDYEGMPNALAEAMAIGLPVISTDCLGGGAKELIQDGVNGLLVPIGDKQAVVQAIIYYIEHPEIAEQFAIKGMAIKERLSIEKITAQWLELIK